jgi:hypothetical protein
MVWWQAEILQCLLHIFLFYLCLRTRVDICFWNWKSWNTRPTDIRYRGRSSFSALPSQLDKFNLRAHCSSRAVRQEKSLRPYLLLFMRHLENNVFHTRSVIKIDGSSAIVFLNNESDAVKYTLYFSTTSKLVHYINYIVINVALYTIAGIYLFFCKIKKFTLFE